MTRTDPATDQGSPGPWMLDAIRRSAGRIAITVTREMAAIREIQAEPGYSRATAARIYGTTWEDLRAAHTSIGVLLAEAGQQQGPEVEP